MDMLLFIALVLLSSNTVLNGSLSCSRNQKNIQSCLSVGERFLRSFGRSARKSENKDCRIFQPFEECFESILRCPDFNELNISKSWQDIFDLFWCSCHENEPNYKGCLHDVKCFKRQYNGIFSRRCDAIYRFYAKQFPADKCYFHTQNVQCIESLMTSSCGLDAGNVARHLTKLVAKKVEGCESNIYELKNNVFRYSKMCPSNLDQSLKQCEVTSFGSSRLRFFPENDLIAMGDAEDVLQACRKYTTYRRCIQPYRDTCPEGVSLFFEYENKMRTFDQKMEYICITDQQDYMDHLLCYKDILRNATFKSCNSVYLSLLPLLNRVSAYELYCEPGANNSQAVLQHLQKLEECYVDIYNRSCGERGSLAMGSLMNLAFKDPYYLRFRFKPDCSIFENNRTIHSAQKMTTISSLTATYPEINDATANQSNDEMVFKDFFATTNKTFPPETVTSSASLKTSAKLSNVIFWSNAAIVLLFMLIFLIFL